MKLIYVPHVIRLTHLGTFWGNHVRRFKNWREIETHLSLNRGYIVNLTDRDILFGYKLGDIDNYSLENKMIMIAKLSISKYKYGDYTNLMTLFENECNTRNVMM